MPSRIAQTFAASRAEQRLAFMPFITAGDPNVTATQRVIGELSGRGVDLIELGFPYSDPIADGPVIQASYTRALGQKVTVPEIFDAVRPVAAKAPPILAMVSYALVWRRGAEWFLDQARAAGFSGLIVPDLPGDEAADLFELVQSRGLDLVQLVAPTTPRERVRGILASCSGFVYCIAVSGTTGERERVADALLAQLRWLRDETELPLAVGFGISQPQHVEPLRELADGVIVGSAIVRQFEALADKSKTIDQMLAGIGDYAASLVTACRGKK
jgi:tryptophan synthase alpha chain